MQRSTTKLKVHNIKASKCASKKVDIEVSEYGPKVCHPHEEQTSWLEVSELLIGGWHGQTGDVGSSQISGDQH